MKKKTFTKVGAGIAVILFAWMISGCTDSPKKKKKSPIQKDTTEVVKQPAKPKHIPFNADTAYYYIEKQVSFGPRVPNTFSHQLTAKFLAEELDRFADHVFVQEAKVTNHRNEILNIKNIIAEFNPERKDRILLCAHWDTRPLADMDRNRPFEPIDGANDGGSGVGVLLEIARVLDSLDFNRGLDIILFDAEDGGSRDPEEINSWCLGSQFWGNNLHRPDYRARFGILLDMVGAKDATFAREMHSQQNAPGVVDMVWRTAQRLGFGDYFLNMQGGYITDDHQYVYFATRIPTIDIIEYDVNSPNGFGSYWHTHDDNMDIISKETLTAVGKTVMAVVLR